MLHPLKVSVIFGTRPEAIKLAPVILALRNDAAFDCRVCVTAQHRQMLDQVLEVFRIVPDVDLNLMQPNQTLGAFAARCLESLDQYLDQELPRLVLVQGDTTTVLCASLAAFYHRIPLGHVEAGLRTWNLQSPWPEEANRVLTTRLASLHFAPTEANRQNLLKEGVANERIHVTGNSVIDALFFALKRLREHPVPIPGLPRDSLDSFNGAPLVLITGHRRENFGHGLENICHAIAELAQLFSRVQFVYPVHLNPDVRDPVLRILGKLDHSLPNVHLIEPLSYLQFVFLMNRATLILTDSGGVQEEAPSLGKPVLLMRDTTERPEALEAGAVKLVGSSAAVIVAAAAKLLEDPRAFEQMTRARNPYGDGSAAPRIASACKEFLV
jgi:UDP-N-acetylglucosamine 2-epimerase (non-hydrolysing)